MNFKNIEVKLDKDSYFIEIGNRFLSEKASFSLLENKEVLLVYDKKIHSNERKKVQNIVQSFSEGFASIGLEASEKNKTQKTVEAIHNLLLDKGFSRKCVLVGLGGGIICDLCGFAAATYQRGVDFILLPTTLLAQVDASVGGKTAINHPKGKNMIGSFHQPSKVLIDTAFLSTLPEREIKAGMVEMIKHGIIEDENYFKWIEKNINKITSLEEPQISEAIKRSVEIKSNIVSQDERESGIRAILNFGHTFGHGIELIGQYKDYNHGEAVALGMICALRLSEITEKLPEDNLKRIKSMFDQIGIETTISLKINSKDLYSAMQSDKKKLGKKLNFIVLEKMGKAKKISDLSEEIILKVIKSIL